MTTTFMAQPKSWPKDPYFFVKVTVDKNSQQHVWLQNMPVSWGHGKSWDDRQENVSTYSLDTEQLKAFVDAFYSDKNIQNLVWKWENDKLVSRDDVKPKQEITTKDVFGNVVKVGDIIIYSSSYKGGVGAVVIAQVEKIKKAIRAKVLKSSNTYNKHVGETITIVSNFVKVNDVTW